MIAAGGDGTVVSVANGLVHRSVPLGIIPLRTGKLLPRALLIPLRRDDAAGLIAGDHDVVGVDALRGRRSLLLFQCQRRDSREAVRKTTAADKKVFGRLAYVIAMVKRARLFRCSGTCCDSTDEAPNPGSRGGDFEHDDDGEAALAFRPPGKRWATVNSRFTSLPRGP